MEGPGPQTTANLNPWWCSKELSTFFGICNTQTSILLYLYYQLHSTLPLILYCYETFFTGQDYYMDTSVESMFDRPKSCSLPFSFAPFHMPFPHLWTLELCRTLPLICLYPFIKALWIASNGWHTCTVYTTITWGVLPTNRSWCMIWSLFRGHYYRSKS